MIQLKRKAITPKIKLEVFKLGNYTCATCGRSPVTHPGLGLEVDHKKPFSLGGSDEISNYQVLCMECNRGKGNNESLNKFVMNEMNAILNYINPKILQELNKIPTVSVVANQEDFAKIIEKNSHGPFYKITTSGNAIFGERCCYGLGIYTINDNCGAKVNFHITLIP